MAKIEKTFTIGGTSNLNGLTTWRVANGSIGKRTSVLKFHGHTEIKLFELPQPMTRADAAKFMKGCLGVQASMPLSKREVEAPTIGETVVLAAGDEPDYVPPAIVEEPVVAAAPEMTANEKRNARRRAARAAARAAKASEDAAEDAAASTEGLGNGLLPEAVVEAATNTVYAEM